MYTQNPNIFRTRGIFRILAYSEPPYIQNAGIYKIRGIFCQTFCQTSTIKCFEKIVNGYNHFRKLWFISQYKLAAFSTSWNKYHEVVTPEVVIQCKNLWCTRGQQTVSFWYSHWYSNKLAYLQLTTVLVYRNSPSKSYKQDYSNFSPKPWKILVNEFIFRTCNLTENEIFSKVFIFQGFRLKVSEDFFYITSPFIFVVIVNRLCTVFFKIIQNYDNNKINN